MIPASQRSFLPIVHLDFRQNTIPGMAHSLLLVDLDSRRPRGAQHGGVPTTPVLQRSPLPNDPFYRLRNDPRQNTIPVLRWSLLSMDRDFQRSRGGHHGGVPTTPVLQRSPLPNDPFLPVAQRSPSKYHPSPPWKTPCWSMDLDFQRSRGGHHGGVPTTPVL